jgi:peptidyl-prolyl cis-trans isomerase SurA
MKTLIKSTIIVSLVLCMVGVAGAFQESETGHPVMLPHNEKMISMIDRVVAQVEREPILLSELETTARMQANQMGINAQVDSLKYREILNSSLDFLIEQKVLLAQAILDSVLVDDQEIEQVMEERFDSMTGQFGSQAKAEEALGRTYRQLRKMYQGEIKKQMLTERLREQHFSKINVTRSEVQEFFDTKQDSLPQVPTNYKIRHILRTIKAGEEADRIALEAIEQISKMLDEGALFEELARDYSEDPGSATVGGDLGFVNRGEFVREFEEVAFVMEPDEVSDLVKTQYGYHIIKMISKQGERVHVQHILRQVKGTEADEAKTLQSIADIRQQIIDGKPFDEAAVVYSEDPESKDNGGELGLFTVENMQIEEFKEAMAETAVGDISQPFKTSFGYHILTVDEVQESHKLSLEGDWDRIEGAALRYKQAMEFDNWLASLKDDFYIEVKEQLPTVEQ